MDSTTFIRPSVCCGLDNSWADIMLPEHGIRSKVKSLFPQTNGLNAQIK